jgi:hypothetical protein
LHIIMQEDMQKRPYGPIKPLEHFQRLVAILCYVGAERLADAKKLMAECLRLRPQWRRSNHVAPGWVRSPELKAKLLDACIQAGLPD